jgi:hypothetical protein
MTTQPRWCGSPAHIAIAKGQYRLDTLIAIYGAETTLPDLRPLIVQCEREGQLGTACGIYYADLAPRD